MLRGVNDRVEQARALAEVLDPTVFKVNLIPFNSAQIGSVASYRASSPRAIAAFKAVLDRARLPATVRLTRGRDIQAACGQLAAMSASGLM
jgi:23S rRNA (adenine2503-C2)-methyltransferase